MKRGMHVMITDLFEENKVLYQKANVPNQLVELQLEESILEYLSCMGRDLYFYVSEYGVALTSLFSVETILEEAFDEYNKPCIENGYLVIGKGPNGDLLCVDIKQSTVGYAYHDDLWEGLFEDFSDIYIEMPILLDDFIEMMLTDKNHYPFDGYEAEKYL